MRRTIETAPRDGKVVILEDDVFGTLEVARWSSEAGEWVGENGEPIKITSSHWYPMQRDNYLQQGHDVSSSPSQAGPSASRARRYSFLFPFASSRAAPQRLQTAPVEAKRAPHARRRFAASLIAATLVGAALIGLNFRAEVSAYVTRYVRQQDIFRISAIGNQVADQEIQLPSQDSRKTDLLPFQQQAEADQTSTQAGAQEAAQVKHAEASAPGARQSLEKDQRPEGLANELAEARRAINGLNLQLQAGATKTAQLLGQEREKTAALAQDATAARQELTESTVQHRRALEEERVRSAALASELAMARREIETQVALLRKAGDEAAQLKQATESATAELRQSLQRERDEFIERQRGHAAEQKPAAVEERPGISLPAWVNSDALVKPDQTATQSKAAPENSQPVIKPVERVPLPRERAMSPNDRYGCQQYRTYDPASGTYRGYDGRRRSCP
jgi:hypothetical protein